jgi:hypothetical protein
VEEWADELLRGLALAAAEQRHPGWAAVLIDALSARTKPGDPDWDLVSALYPALPPDELVRRAMTALATGDQRAAWLLPEVPAPWPDELSAAALAGFEAAARQGRAYSVVTVAHAAGLGMDPSFAGAAGVVADRLRAEQHNRFDAFERLAAILRLRHDMIQEIG